MSRVLVKEIAALYNNGWRPFSGHIAHAVYEGLPCGRVRTEGTQQLPLATLQDVAPDNDAAAAPRAANAKPARAEKRPAPYWFFCGDAYLCLGCARRCALTRPRGFQLLLELRYNTTRDKYTLTPQEMVQKLNQLTVEQAAYCLNISRNQVYHWVREGKLPRSNTEVMRIPVAAVRELLQERED